MKGSIRIELTQGEAYYLPLVFDEEEALNITKVVISSKYLNFCHELTQDASDYTRWHYTFLPEETKEFKSGNWSFTVTAYNAVAEYNPQKLPNQLIIVKKDNNPPEEVET